MCYDTKWEEFAFIEVMNHNFLVFSIGVMDAG